MNHAVVQHVQKQTCQPWFLPSVVIVVVVVGHTEKVFVFVRNVHGTIDRSLSGVQIGGRRYRLPPKQPFSTVAFLWNVHAELGPGVANGVVTRRQHVDPQLIAVHALQTDRIVCTAHQASVDVEMTRKLSTQLTSLPNYASCICKSATVEG